MCYVTLLQMQIKDTGWLSRSAMAIASLYNSIVVISLPETTNNFSP